jgi:hypothetical protein
VLVAIGDEAVQRNDDLQVKYTQDEGDGSRGDRNLYLTCSRVGAPEGTITSGAAVSGRVAA